MPFSTQMPSQTVLIMFSSSPIVSATTSATTTTRTTQDSTHEPITETLSAYLGEIIVVVACVTACCLLGLMCCCVVCCCLCCCKQSDKRKGYRRAGDMGDYPDDDMVAGKRFHYRRIQQGHVETIELPTLAPIPTHDKYKQKILPEHFKQHLDTLWAADFAGLREEFDALEAPKMRHMSNVANLHSEIQKNRDFKLIPYDHNRVKLRQSNSIKPSDYINASYIRAPVIDRMFLVAQAPMDNTVNEFWQVVSEQNVSNIVRLIPGGQEDQSGIPSERHPRRMLGGVEVTFEGEEQGASFSFRRLKVKNEAGNVKHVLHAHFREWLRSGVPKFHQEFVKFIVEFRQKMTDDTSPTMIYSVTGCGQTGVFVACYTLMDMIHSSVPFSVYETVLDLLDQKMYALQSLEDYRFVYLLVLELLCDSTSLSVAEFPDAVRVYMDSLRDTHQSTFHQQFSELSYQVEKTYSRPQEDALNPINRSKNTTPHVLPYDDTRVVLFSEFWEAGDYINASYVDGNRDPQYFIATTHPIRETILEFLQMVYQSAAPLVILLATEDEYALLETGLDGSVCYWGEEGQGYGMYSVETLGITSSVGLTRNKIKITNHSEKSTHTFVQYVCVNFLDNNKPTNSQPIIHLSELILKFKQDYPNNPVIVHCWDGVGKTGVVMACCLAVQGIIADQRVDLFHIVKSMRRGREKMVSPVVS